MRPWITLLLFLFVLPAFGQSPYQLKVQDELAFVGIGIGLNGISGYLGAKADVLSPEAIKQLDPNKIPGIDRWVIRQYSKGARRTSDYFLYSSFALPALLLLDNPGRDDVGKLGLFTLQTLLINSGLTNITKVTARRPRPYLYNDAFFLDHPRDLPIRKSDTYSFFSGHTSTTAAMSFLAAKLHNDFYPASQNRGKIWILAAAIPAYTGIQRMRAGKHFLTDVLLGYVVGASVGLLVPELHKL